MLATLHDKGVEVKVWKLRRIMRENGLYPVTLKKWKPYRKGKCDAMYSENLVQRKCDPDNLNVVCAGDITYVKTTLGCVNFFPNAIMQRGHHDGLIFHSDRGLQYSSMGYRTMLSENGIAPSMSAPGRPYDNAFMESFFASFKKGLAYRRDIKDLEDVREAVFRYIKLFYNRKRLHSSPGYMTPVEYRLSKQAA